MAMRLTAAAAAALKQPRASDDESSSSGPPPRVPTYIPLATVQAQASQAPQHGLGTGPAVGLLPIRVDVDVGGHRLVDSFLLDPTNVQMGPEQLAARLIADLEMPGGLHARREMEARVAQSIRAQLAAAAALHTPKRGALGSVLVPLSLRVRAAGFVYEDTVEWDVGEEAGNAPEAFAMRTVADLGLPPEFEPAIALSLREQILTYRELLATGKAPATLPDPTLLKPDPNAPAPAAAASPPSSPTATKKGKKKRAAAAEESSAPAFLVRSVDPLEGAERAVRREGAEAEAWAPKLEALPLKDQLLYATNALRLAKPLNPHAPAPAPAHAPSTTTTSSAKAPAGAPKQPKAAAAPKASKKAPAPAAARAQAPAPQQQPMQMQGQQQAAIQAQREAYLRYYAQLPPEQQQILYNQQLQQWQRWQQQQQQQQQQQMYAQQQQQPPPR